MLCNCRIQFDSDGKECQLKKKKGLGQADCKWKSDYEAKYDMKNQEKETEVYKKFGVMLKPYFKMDETGKKPIISQSEIVVGDSVEMVWNMELEVEGLKYENQFMIDRDGLIKFLGTSIKAEKFEENEP